MYFTVFNIVPSPPRANNKSSPSATSFDNPREFLNTIILHPGNIP